MNRTYTTAEASQILGVSIRVLQIELKALGVKKSKNRYIITDDVINALKAKETTETKTIQETFTQQEYDRLEMIIKEYPVLQERLKNYEDQIFYLKSLIESQTLQLHKIMALMEQRNLIDYNTKPPK